MTGVGSWEASDGYKGPANEMRRLQGLPLSVHAQAAVVSPVQMGRMVGNAMSVNVVERILARLLPAAGLVSVDALRDIGSRRHSSCC